MAKQRWVFINPFQMRLQRGIEVYIWELPSALVDRGLDIDILTWDGPLVIPPYVPPQVKIKRAPYVRYFQHLMSIPYYIWHLVNGHYDHVFVHFAGYGEGPALKFSRSLRNTPFSVIFQFPRSLVPDRYSEFSRWGFSRDASHLIGVSQATAREVELWAGRSCKVIDQGVDTERFNFDETLRALTRQELNISPKASVLISVAALEERKGIQWGIQALATILKDHSDTFYVIVGNGPYRMQLEALVESLGIKANVFFLGRRRNVHPYLCAADIMLVLSQGEAGSVSLFEAMACQLPAITSDSPPFDEWVNNDWGLKVEQNDIKALGISIIKLIQNRDIRVEMGKAGRVYVKNHHAWSLIAEQYENLL